MSSTKRFLRNLVFQDDGTSEPTPKADANSAFKGPANVPTTNVQNFSATQNVQGVVDNKFIDTLTGIIEQNNLPGQDYFEFKQAIENLKSMAGMTDQQKFQTIYAVLSNQGLTKAILLSSLDKYISIIQNEKTNFDDQMEAQYKDRVTSKLAEADKSKKELETITKRMGELNTIILNLTQEAGAEEMKLRATEANFKASADVIVNEMLSDKEKINNFIK
jgi:hypothetical protein